MLTRSEGRPREGRGEEATGRPNPPTPGLWTTPPQPPPDSEEIRVCLLQAVQADGDRGRRGHGPTFRPSTFLGTLRTTVDDAHVPLRSVRGWFTSVKSSHFGRKAKARVHSTRAGRGARARSRGLAASMSPAAPSILVRPEVTFLKGRVNSLRPRECSPGLGGRHTRRPGQAGASSGSGRVNSTHSLKLI